MTKKVDIMIDLQFGSTGKGLLAGVLAQERGYDCVINANMPNAGHTFIDRNGVEYMHKVLPNGIIADSVKMAMLGPGSVFSAERLEEEITWLLHNKKLDGKKIYIHQGAMIVNHRDKQNEQRMVEAIGSTAQGSAEAMIRKIRRFEPTVGDLLEAIKHIPEVMVLSPLDWQLMLRESKNILLEGAQGFSLGVNQGFYPFCTSRDCTPSRFMTDCNIPLPYYRSTIGVARLHPIRVGGNSGGHYSDQHELEWPDVGVAPETTTVTGRERRIFSFSRRQTFEAIIECMPNEVFLNFCNYAEIDADVLETIHSINAILAVWSVPGSRVTYTGWGPREFEVHKVEPEDVGDVSN